MGVRQIDLPPEEATDLASLWSRAVQEYELKTNANISKLGAQSTDQVARNIAEVMDAAENKGDKFIGFRHKKDKASKARHAIGNQLDGMKKCLDGIAMVGAAAAVFPPAMPVQLVFAACGRVLGVSPTCSAFNIMLMSLRHSWAFKRI
jgi:hypothetical protein